MGENSIAVYAGRLTVWVGLSAAGADEASHPLTCRPHRPVFLQMDLGGALQVGLVHVVFAFLFVDLFDNTGTLIALAHRGGFMRPDGTVPRLNRA